MSDAFLTEFWAKAPPPWNKRGPELAERIKLGILPTLPPSTLFVWAQQLRDARKTARLSQATAARHCDLNEDEVHLIETNRASKGSRGWAKLAAFYGITLK
jgi:ribosome-binding protein aMBF1 (putative translation factor)